MGDYGKMLDFLLMEQEAANRSFETAKHSPFLFLLTPPVTDGVIPAWQPLLFTPIGETAATVDAAVVLPDRPIESDELLARQKIG